MRKIISIIAALASLTAGFCADVSNDLILTQRKPDNSGNIQRNVPATGAITSGSLPSFQSAVGIGTFLKSATTSVGVSAATAPTSGQVLTATSGTAATWQTPAISGGDVVGPASSTDNAIARFDLATGKLIQNSVVRIDDLGNVIIPSTATDGLKIFESAAEVTSANFGQMVWIGNEWNIMTDRTAPAGAVRGMSLTAYGTSHNERSTMNINEKSTAAAPAFAVYVGTGGAGVTAAKPDGHFIFYDASSTQQKQSSGYSEMVKISSKLTQTGSAAFVSLGLHRTVTSKGSGVQGFLTCNTAIDDTGLVFFLDDAGKITTYNGLTTAGNGVATIQGSGRVTAQVAASASVMSYTVGASDASFLISANVNVTTSATHAFTVTCAYTDETNVARTLTLGFTQLTGATLLTSITNVTGGGPYESIPYHIRCKAATTVTVATTGTFTTVTYNAEANLTKLQ